MPSQYPGNLDSLPTTRVTGNTIVASDHNDTADAVNKIEAELGTNPRGSAASVKARLETLAPKANLPINAADYGVLPGNTAAQNNTPLANWLAAIAGKEGYLPAGTYNYSVGLTGGALNTTISGDGKGGARLNYTGTGVALTWGTGVSTANMNFVLERIRIDGTAAATGGLRLWTFQDFTLINVDVRGFSNGFGIFEDNVNSGLALNCNVRQNSVGWRVGFNANLNTHIGGQITENGVGVHADADDSWNNEWIGANFAVNNRAVYFQHGQLNILRRCWFESNVQGQPIPASILVGDLNDVGTADFSRVIDCYFSESNIAYAVRVYRGTETRLEGNEHSGTGATAFARLDPGAIDTIVRDNVKGTAPLLDDAGVRTRAGGPGFTVPSIASANSITIPPGVDIAAVTGTVTINTITGSYVGRRITLRFTGALTVADGGGATTLQLAGNFVTTADDTLSLIWDGTFWHETSRSAN